MSCIFVISAPSGAGKTSLVKSLINATKNLVVAVSHTTRPQRAAENNGINYNFVSLEEFNSLIRKGEMVEYAKVFGNMYGTTKQAISQAIANNNDLILEIDWQGYRQIKDCFDNVCGIFILPPSLKALEKRLLARKQDDPSTIKSRMQQAESEISHYAEYDYLVVNDDFSQALKDLQVILNAKHLETNISIKKSNINLEF